MRSSRPRHVRDPAHQPLSHLVPAQPVGPGATQDAQHVVLRRGDVERLERLHQRVLEEGGGPGDVEEGLFLDAPRLALLELVLEGVRAVTKP